MTDAMTVDSPDGSVALYRAADGLYAAEATELGQEPVWVSWHRAKGARSVYRCDVHGESPRFDLCPHTRAAVRAAEIWRSA